MKRVLWAIGGLLVLLVAAVLIGLGLVDWNQYKGDIQNQARDATGRELIINGDISITVLPAPALIANDVLLANIEGAASKNMLRLKYLEVRIAEPQRSRAEARVADMCNKLLSNPVIEEFRFELEEASTS